MENVRFRLLTDATGYYRQSHVYAKKGDLVSLIATHGHVWIVECESRVRFPVDMIQIIPMETLSSSSNDFEGKLVQFHQRRIMQYAERKGMNETEARFFIADLNSRLSPGAVAAEIDAVVDPEWHSSNQPYYG
jgi:hypothetical protein